MRRQLITNSPLLPCLPRYLLNDDRPPQPPCGAHATTMQPPPPLLPLLLSLCSLSALLYPSLSLRSRRELYTTDIPGRYLGISSGPGQVGTPRTYIHAHLPAHIPAQMLHTWFIHFGLILMRPGSVQACEARTTRPSTNAAPPAADSSMPVSNWLQERVDAVIGCS